MSSELCSKPRCNNPGQSYTVVGPGVPAFRVILCEQHDVMRDLAALVTPRAATPTGGRKVLTPEYMRGLIDRSR